MGKQKYSKLSDLKKWLKKNEKNPKIKKKEIKTVKQLCVLWEKAEENIETSRKKLKQLQWWENH
ncbi:MAG: hypothetical protein WC460_06225 [Patescibacteria group bacterium]